MNLPREIVEIKAVVENEDHRTVVFNTKTIKMLLDYIDKQTTEMALINKKLEELGEMGEIILASCKPNVMDSSKSLDESITTISPDLVWREQNDNSNRL